MTVNFLKVLQKSMCDEENDREREGQRTMSKYYDDDPSWKLSTHFQSFSPTLEWARKIVSNR